MKKIRTDEIQAELNIMIMEKREDFIYCIYDSPVVFRSLSNDVNVEYCKGKTIINTGNMGGTIVSSKGDFGIAILKFNGWNVGEDAMLFLLDKLKGKIPSLSFKSNDLLAEDVFKLASYASINVGDGFIYTIIEISIDPNIEDINNICSKQTNKVPRGLSYYGVTANDIEKIFADFKV